jgi:hypothetical protein
VKNDLKRGVFSQQTHAHQVVAITAPKKPIIPEMTLFRNQHDKDDRLVKRLKNHA